MRCVSLCEIHMNRSILAGKGISMSFIHVQHLCKRFYVQKKRKNDALLREKETVEALKDVSFQI